MKNLKLIGFLVLIASSLMFIQCTSEPIPGPQGEAGIDGVDGVDGEDGADGIDTVANCIECHSDTHRVPIHEAYEESGHASGNTLGYAAYGADCASCHSNEGYVEYITTGSNTSKPNGTAIGCATCHSDHSTFDFENDGQDYALRNIEELDLIIGVSEDNTSGKIDFEGTSNNCAYCHQPRKLRPTEYADTVNGMFDVPSHYGPHYGAQTSMLQGIQGEHITGSEVYPVAGSSTHRTGMNDIESSCVSCHMGTPDGEDGAHTFAPTLNTCTQCHSSATDFDYNGVQTEVETLMHDIEVLLIAEGILSDSGSLVTGDHPIEIVKAYWNWEFVHQDGSHGIHNPAYTLALLKNTKTYLESLQST